MFASRRDFNFAVYILHGLCEVEVKSPLCCVSTRRSSVSANYSILATRDARRVPVRNKAHLITYNIIQIGYRKETSIDSI